MRLSARTLEAELEGVPENIRTRVMIFRLFISLGGRLRTLMDRQLESAGITTQQAACLNITGAAEEPLAQGELARALGVSHQNVRQLTDVLERKGLIEVVSDPNDRRTKRIRTTKAAKKIFARRNTEDHRMVAGWLGSLDDREAEALLAFLLRVAEGLPDRAP